MQKFLQIDFIYYFKLPRFLCKIFLPLHPIGSKQGLREKMGAVAVGAAQVQEVVGQATAVVGVPAACEAVSQQARRAQPARPHLGPV